MFLGVVDNLEIEQHLAKYYNINYFKKNLKPNYVYNLTIINNVRTPVVP